MASSTKNDLQEALELTDQTVVSVRRQGQSRDEKTRLSTLRNFILQSVALVAITGSYNDLNDLPESSGSGLPDQTGNSGKYLTTNGTDASWATISGGGDLLSTNNLSDLTNASTARTNLGLGGLAVLSSVGDSQVSAGIDAAKIGGGAVSNTEFSYLDGVTSAIQTQLNARTSAASTITDNAIVRGDGGSRGVQSSGITIDDSNNVTGMNQLEVTTYVSAEDLYAGNSVVIDDGFLALNGGYISSCTTISMYGATSKIIAPSNAIGQVLKICGWDIDGAAAVDFITITSANTPTCDLADSVTKGGGYIYRAGGTDVPISDGGTGAGTASDARTALGLAIGSDVQAYNANLTTWAGKTAPSGTVVGTSDSQTLSSKTIDNTNGITVKDNAFTLQDNSDTTKQAVFELSGITASNTRTITLSDASGINALRSAGVFDAAIGSTITWDGTPPSSAVALRYSWEIVGGWCHAQFRLEYTNAGSTNTSVTIDIPNDMPLPADFTGISDTEVMLAGTGNAYTGLTGAGSQAKVMIYKDASASSGYLFACKGFTSNTYKGAVMQFSYPIASGSRL